MNCYKSDTTGLKFQYSSKLGEIKNDGEKLSFTITDPSKNMQTDEANFEAIALMLRCVEPGCRVEVDFKLSGWPKGGKDKSEYMGWDGEFGKKSVSANAYLRFLYRAYIFRRAFDWVSFSPAASAEIDRFVAKLEGSPYSNNVPEDNATYNKERGGEYQVEYKFAHSERGRDYLDSLFHDKTNIRLKAGTINNQLKNGLFNVAPNGKAEEANRIFTTGAYDIWAIAEDGSFCVFELKTKDNRKLGIISELFFYAAYAKEVLLNTARVHDPEHKQNYRGYKDLYAAVKGNSISGVNALFLVAENGVHPDIDKARLIDELNKNSFGIKFDFLFYDPDVINRISSGEVNQGVILSSV